LLIWHAFNHAEKKERLIIKRIMEEKSARKQELVKIRRIIVDTGALSYAEGQIKNLITKSGAELNGLRMDKRYKQALENFSVNILKL